MMSEDTGPEIRHVESIYWQDTKTGKFYFNDETERLYPEWNNPQPYDTLQQAMAASVEYAKHL